MRKIMALGMMIMSVAGSGIGKSVPAEGAFEIRGMKGLFWDGIEKYNKALPWMAEHDLNWLMFCYTMYPESARDWRKDYTPQQVAEMKALVTKAQDTGVTVCLSFNPGIWSNPPLVHSSEEDYQAAWRKVKMAQSIGIYEIALCLDDIAKGIVPADKAKYGTLEAAQMAYTNRMWEDMKALDPRMKLIFCPSAYTTKEMREHAEYTKYVGENLNPEIAIFWTGVEVCSPTITVADAQEAERLFKRKPFVWDNYPVNDMFPWRPLLSPVKGRDAKLAGAVSGFLANPMKQWEANRIPMVSVAEYLNDPVGYDPEQARLKTLKEFAEADRPTVELLMKYYGSSFWGEKGFPPGPRFETPAEAQKLADDLRQLKADMTASTSSLNAMWLDVKDTVEADLTQAEMIGEGPVARGKAMTGGARDLAEKAFGEPAGLVYAKPTGKSRVAVELPVDELTSEPKRLRLFARNGDRLKPRVKITLNGHAIADGMLEFSQSEFDVREFEIPAGAIGAGKASLLIENLETTGSAVMPPWFAVKGVQLLP